MTASRDWATFLRIPSPSTTDTAPALDPSWCRAAGVGSGAEIVLRLLRDEVLPLVRTLEVEYPSPTYHFLIHDRQSGVPTTEDDHGAFIHLRLFFSDPVPLDLSRWPKFEMTRSVDDAGQTTVGGIDPTLIKDHAVETVARLLHLQSAWVLSLIEAHKWDDDVKMVRQVKQFGHFLCNMLQMSFG